MSFRAEVQADSTGQWYPNATRFATEEEAKAYAVDLQWRWLAVRAFRVVRVDDPVNYRWDPKQGLVAAEPATV